MNLIYLNSSREGRGSWGGGGRLIRPNTMKGKLTLCYSFPIMGNSFSINIYDTNYLSISLLPKTMEVSKQGRGCRLSTLCNHVMLKYQYVMIKNHHLIKNYHTITIIQIRQLLRLFICTNVFNFCFKPFINLNKVLPLYTTA